MPVCMYVCMYGCMSCIYVCVYAWPYVRMYVTSRVATHRFAPEFNTGFNERLCIQASYDVNTFFFSSQHRLASMTQRDISCCLMGSTQC